MVYKRIPESQLKVNIHHEVLTSATSKLIDKFGAVYRDELQLETGGLFNETITAWLKREGFVRAGSINCKRWVNKNWLPNRYQKANGCEPR
jgi:hypothetical protein